MKILPWAHTVVALLTLLTAASRALAAEQPEKLVEESKKITREDETRLTPEEKAAIEGFNALNSAEPIENNTDLLRGITRVSVEVSLNEALSKVWSTSEIKDKITLELRRSGIEVVDRAPQATVRFGADGLLHSDRTITSYSTKMSVWFVVSAMTYEYKYHRWLTEVWERSDVGYFGSAKAADSQRDVVTQRAEELASAFLEANPIRRDR